MKETYTKEQLQSKVNSIGWYHRIHIAQGIFTEPAVHFREVAELLDQGMDKVNFFGKAVLDVGTRDGKYAFEAEARGGIVTAIDNNPSEGFKFLWDFYDSKIEFYAANLYTLPRVEKFDVILFFGVLYHLRYPMNGLRILTQKLDPGGKMYIESGMMDDYHNLPLLHCPARNSPYEVTSCSFFNIEGLEETLWSFGCTVKDFKKHPDQSGQRIRRYWIEAEKTHEPDPEVMGYWEGMHHSHH